MPWTSRARISVTRRRGLGLPTDTTDPEVHVAIDTIQSSLPSRRRRYVVAGAVVALAVALVGLIWFQPQKLFIDDTVNEAAPLVAERTVVEPRTDASAARTTPPRERRGSFSSLAHPTKGTATVLTLDDGSQVLRFEGFETSNGPDVRVYLSAGDRDSYGKDFIDLGGLKGNIGDQNYAIPSGTDLDRYDIAVIWCRRFTVAFGDATLE
jgi:hypothetical protein